jgi:O-antigen ligase
MNLGAWQIWLDNIWIGTGLGDSENDFDQLKKIGPLIVADNSELVKLISNHMFHNIFADSFSTTGLIGGTTMIITVLWLPIRFFLIALRRAGENPVTRFAAYSGIGIGCINIVFGFTNSWLYLNNLPYTLTLMILFMVLIHNSIRTPTAPALRE